MGRPDGRSGALDEDMALDAGNAGEVAHVVDPRRNSIAAVSFEIDADIAVAHASRLSCLLSRR